jgi:hypothetical protein
MCFLWSHEPPSVVVVAWPMGDGLDMDMGLTVTHSNGATGRVWAMGAFAVVGT